MIENKIVNIINFSPTSENIGVVPELNIMYTTYTYVIKNHSKHKRLLTLKGNNFPKIPEYGELYERFLSYLPSTMNVDLESFKRHFNEFYLFLQTAYNFFMMTKNVKELVIYEPLIRITHNDESPFSYETRAMYDKIPIIWQTLFSMKDNNGIYYGTCVEDTSPYFDRDRRFNFEVLLHDVRTSTYKQDIIPKTRGYYNLGKNGDVLTNYILKLQLEHFWQYKIATPQIATICSFPLMGIKQDEEIVECYQQKYNYSVNIINSFDSRMFEVHMNMYNVVLGFNIDDNYCPLIQRDYLKIKKKERKIDISYEKKEEIVALIGTLAGSFTKNYQ